MQKPKILFIGGAGRSGSTLLELMLGELDGFVRAGEVTHLWQRGVLENQLCGCGTPFQDCDFWQRVLAQSFGTLDRQEAEQIQALNKRCCRLTSIPLILSQRLRSRAFQETLLQYTDALQNLYEGLWRTTGASMIVDSSKYPAEAFLLQSMPGIDVFFLHLVRDARGVVHSWQRRKQRVEIHWEKVLMPRYPAAQTAMAWNVYNLLFQYLGRRRPSHYLRLQYEALISEPQAALESVVAFIDSNASTERILSGSTVALTTNHTVSGNPVRFKTGPLTLRHDEAWKKEMAPWKKMLVMGMTWPLLSSYRYGWNGADRHITGA